MPKSSLLYWLCGRVPHHPPHPPPLGSETNKDSTSSDTRTMRGACRVTDEPQRIADTNRERVSAVTDHPLAHCRSFDCVFGDKRVVSVFFEMIVIIHNLNPGLWIRNPFYGSHNNTAWTGSEFLNTYIKPSLSDESYNFLNTYILKSTDGFFRHKSTKNKTLSHSDNS